MDEYIKRIDANCAVTDAIWHGKRSMHDVASAINIVPSADVAPVRHWRWETEMDDMGWLKHTCPICGYVKRTDIHVSLGWHYCPNCGAKMDGGED